MTAKASGRAWRRILLISESEGTSDELGQALAETGFDHQFFWVSQPDLALSRAQDTAPDIILVDGELEGANAIALIAQLVSRVPRAEVLALLGAGAVAKASQAVLSGARGFIMKPVQPDELMTTLEHVLTHRSSAESPAEEQASKGRVIIFCIPKGGTGCSTLAINTAVSLRMITGQPVALIDADYLAPALDVALNLRSERNISDLLLRGAGVDEELVMGVLVGHASGIQVLLAPLPTGQLTDTASPTQLHHILVLLQRMFAWVVVDLGLPRCDHTACAFMDEADRIVMLVSPEMVALRNAPLMLRRLQARGFSDDKVWLVINRATMRGGIRARDIEERLHLAVKQRIPDDQALTTYSINLGVPLAMGYRRSAVALAVRELAQRLVTDLLAETAETPKEWRAQMPAKKEPASMRSLLNRLVPAWGRRGRRGLAKQGQEGTS